MRPDFVTLPELFTCAVARTIPDGAVTFHGFGSPVPTLAMLVAKRTHAPHMVHVEGATYALDPDPHFLTPTSNDWAMENGAVARLGIEDLFDLAPRGQLGRMFFSGGQIDKYANLNVTMIGTPDKVRVKLPGGGGGCNLSADVTNFTVWTPSHRINPGPRKVYRLVERVDYVTSLGLRTPDGLTRRELGYSGGGPDWVVTELGVFDFDPETSVMRLHYLYPDTTVEDVLANTEFTPVIAPDVSEIPLPDPEAVDLIRRYDPLGVHLLEFKPADRERRFSLARTI